VGGVTAAVVARASASHASRARMPLPVQQVAGEFPSFSVCLPEGRSVSQSVNQSIIIFNIRIIIPVVPHKAVAEVSKIGNL